MPNDSPGREDKRSSRSRAAPPRPQQVDFKETLKRILDGEVDDWTGAQRERAAQELVRAASVSAGLVALQPVPFLDPVFVTPIQIGMVQGMARIRGYRLDRKSALEVLRTFRASLLTRHLVIAGAKVVPGLGALVSAPLAYALTYALGEVADRYFERGRSMLPAEMQATLDRFYQATLKHIYSAKGHELRALIERGRRALHRRPREPHPA